MCVCARADVHTHFCLLLFLYVFGSCFLFLYSSFFFFFLLFFFFGGGGGPHINTFSPTVHTNKQYCEKRAICSLDKGFVCLEIIMKSEVAFKASTF